MYQSIYYDKEEKKIYIVDDKLGFITFDYEPYYYKPVDKSDYQTIYKQPVQKTKHYDEDYFEIDVPPILRTLVDKYYFPWYRNIFQKRISES